MLHKMVGYHLYLVDKLLQMQVLMQIQVLAPRDYFNGLIQLFPHCRPEEGGYLSFDFLLNHVVGVEPRADSAAMQVLSAEYKMVKQLSDNPDLISRS